MEVFDRVPVAGQVELGVQVVGVKNGIALASGTVMSTVSVFPVAQYLQTDLFTDFLREAPASHRGEIESRWFPHAG